MPWCDDCERYYAPSAMTPEGHCPRCDADLLAPDADRPSAGTDDAGAGAGAGDDAGDEKVPWHFKLMVVLLVAYLGWRLVDLVV
jgi:hypothetical protein